MGMGGGHGSTRGPCLTHLPKEMLPVPADPPPCACTCVEWGRRVDGSEIGYMRSETAAGLSSSEPNLCASVVAGVMLLVVVVRSSIDQSINCAPDRGVSNLSAVGERRPSRPQILHPIATSITNFTSILLPSNTQPQPQPARIMPQKHSKNNTDAAVFTYDERRKAGYGTTRQRLGTDSHQPFGYCCLSLKPVVDPVVRSVPLLVCPWGMDGSMACFPACLPACLDPSRSIHPSHRC